MALSIADYLLQLPENLHFAKVQELSGDGIFCYRMLSDYGSGSCQLIRFDNDLLMILIADYTPKETFEKTATISEEYMEISQFETDSSSFKIGGRKTQPVGKGIYCYVNNQKTTYVYCEKGKPVRFTKIILTRKYFDTYFRVHYGKDYEQSKLAKEYLLKNPNLPELNFVFQQIRDCQAEGPTLHLYLEGKVLELLSLVIKGMEQKENHISVKLDYRDIRGLRKTVTHMKKDLSAYPSGEELARIAGMSPARYQLAFRKYYGTTPYEYLKEMRLNQALLLLKNSDYGIAVIAAKVGYHNSGHFAKLFKNAYCLGPREYRKVQQIK
jgi:AraC-like DNA-binding protein